MTVYHWFWESVIAEEGTGRVWIYRYESEAELWADVVASLRMTRRAGNYVHVTEDKARIVLDDGRIKEMTWRKTPAKVAEPG